MYPLVSIIIPVYNSAKIIERALSDILLQTYPNLEIIVVDDGSSDNSFELAKQYEGINFIVCRQPNGGAAKARNKGVSLANGKYIQFLDIDDFLSKDKIAKQVYELEKNNGYVAVCNYIEFLNDKIPETLAVPDGQDKFIFSTSDPVAFLINLYGGNGQPNFIQTNSWLVPKTLIENVGGWRPYRCPDDDGEFFARILLASKGIVYVPGVYNFYRRTAKEASLSSTTKRKYLQNSLLTIDLKHTYLRNYSHAPNLDKAIATQYLLFAVYSYPKHRVLSTIAYKRYRYLATNLNLPVLGGTLIELIKRLFGWKTARFLKYYLREGGI